MRLCICVKQIVVDHIGSYLNESCHPFKQEIMHSSLHSKQTQTKADFVTSILMAQVCPSPYQRDVFPMHWA